VSVEDRLAALEVEWPETPDVAPRVRARLEARPRGRRRLRVVLAALLILLGGVAAVEPARSTVLDWLGIGGETIERVPEQPTPAPSSTPPEFGNRIPLPPDAPVPAALGRPDAVYEENEIVTLDYRRPRAVLSYFPGRTNQQFVRKFAGPDTTIDRVTVDGEPGFWVAGALHGVIYENERGTIVEAPARLAGRTLVWRRGDRTLRLEADISKERALEIARSIP